MANVSEPGGADDYATWDTAYEAKAVALLTIGFGLVGLDRWILPPLFAAGMGQELGLTPADLGNLVGALGLAWGISAIVMGRLSDRIGRRKVLAPAVMLFSLLSLFTGLATGLVSLILVRALMGVAEGAVAPAGVAAAVEASHPKRRGLNNGLFQCAFALFGLAIAPILATQLLQVTNWHNIFMIVAIPGALVAVMMWFVIREPINETVARARPPANAALAGSIFAHRNVVLAMFGLLCAMSGIFVIGAMMPSYLTGPDSYLKLSPQEMGFVTSAIGFGGFIGQLGVPGISDIIGRRAAAIGSFVLSAFFLMCFIRTGPDSTPTLFALLFCASLFNFGALALIAGPIAAEAAPLGMIASVAGVVIGTGEIFGGGIAPALAGNIAGHYGIQYTLWFALGGQMLGVVVSLLFQETAPKFVSQDAA